MAVETLGHAFRKQGITASFIKSLPDDERVARFTELVNKYGKGNPVLGLSLVMPALMSWQVQGRDEQMIPDPLHGGRSTPWTFWLYLAGRGAGKTRTGAETCREWVRTGSKRIGLIAPTAADVRDVMVEGESGILAVCQDSDVDIDGVHMGKPLYEPSKRQLTWANGAIAKLYSADEPERLRGPQHEKIWADELCAWRRPETWDLAQFGLRLGDMPQAFISTTPKPKKLIIDLTKDPACVITRGSTFSNAANLAGQFLAYIKKKYENTRLGQQELEGVLLEESEGALWNRELIDKTRKGAIPSNVWFKRIVVAVDPATTADKDSDETGIVVVGVGSDDHGYVLADYSGRYTPAQWAKKVCFAYREWQADRIVAEGNQGGLMVSHTIWSEDPNAPVTIVHASKGKAARAEPVAALFEQNRCHLVGSFREMEDQLCVWEPLSGDASPDRLDALVWGVTEVMLTAGETGEGPLAGGY